MQRARLAPLALTLSLAAIAPVMSARALETDQFTVPDRPLPDLGPETDVYVAALVWDVAQQMNARAADQERAARTTSLPFMRSYHRGRAARYRSADLLTKRVFDAVAGPGLPESRLEDWVRHHDFRAAREAGVSNPCFETTLARCVYGDSLFNKPLLLAFLSPTANFYGTYMGVDKLGHVFQHGYFYYQEYRRAESDGADDAKAAARAVRMGVGEERGFYGEITTGVYSNADLAANYAGLKFYLNLTRPVRIGDAELPPLLVRGRRGDWGFNPLRRPDESLRVLVGDHFNEALNPSRLERVLCGTVKDRLKRRAERLLDFYDTSPQRERERMAGLTTWHGEKYGHSGFVRVVSIADNCPVRDLPAGDEPGVVVAGGRATAAPPAASDRAGASPAAPASSGGRSTPARLSIR